MRVIVRGEVERGCVVWLSGETRTAGCGDVVWNSSCCGTARYGGLSACVWVKIVCATGCSVDPTVNEAVCGLVWLCMLPAVAAAFVLRLVRFWILLCVYHVPLHAGDWSFVRLCPG